MKKNPDSPRTPLPSTTRSNSDWVMIVLGIALIALFIAAGYDALTGPENRARSKPRGPVKDPDRVGSLRDGIGSRGSTDSAVARPHTEVYARDRGKTSQSQVGRPGSGRSRGGADELQEQNPPDGLTGMSMPFPEGFRQSEQFTIALSGSKCQHDTRGQKSIQVQAGKRARHALSLRGVKRRSNLPSSAVEIATLLSQGHA